MAISGAGDLTSNFAETVCDTSDLVKLDDVNVQMEDLKVFGSGGFQCKIRKCVGLAHELLVGATR